MRAFLLIILFFLRGSCLQAQFLLPLKFHEQPVLEQGIPVEPYALFYENPSGDTTQPLLEVAQQQFIPAASVSDIRFMNNRQMRKTSQVVWLQFQLVNTNPMDTLRLWYGGGPHAFLSLYQKRSDSFHFIARAGMCRFPAKGSIDPFALPLIVPPLTTNHYFLQVADYLLLFDTVAGAIHTKQSYQTFLLREANNTKWLFFAMASIIGCLLLMSLYSFYQYYLSRDKAFFYYSLYAALAFC